MHMALLVCWWLSGVDVSRNGALRCPVTELSHLPGALSRSAAAGGVAFAAVRRRELPRSAGSEHGLARI